MSVDLSGYAVEFYLSAVWTDVTTDVVVEEDGLHFQYGIAGNGPLDRVASTGICSFVLDNSASNSGGRLGYYSPLHANCRAGFTYGMSVRVSFTYAGTTYYKFRGILAAIEPVPGLYRERITRVVVHDWMEQAAQHQVRNVSLQINQRSDQVFSVVLSEIPLQPAASSIAQGRDTFTYALDNLGGSRTSAMQIFQDIAQSELGFIYVKGDTAQGETLIFENRHTRMSTSTNSVSFNDDMLTLEVPQDLNQIYNRVETLISSRTVDAAATTVLYGLPTPQSASIAAGETITIWGDYRDPNGKAVWVGGTSMVAPTAPPDYTMHTLATGGGVDLTTTCTVVASYFASTVKFTITNGHASSAGYLTKLQCRGKGLYRYDAEILQANMTSSQTAYGLRPITVPLPYQDSHAIGQGAAEYLANLYASPLQRVDAISFDANASSTLLTAALATEISGRIGITESVTGIAETLGIGARGWYINQIEYLVTPGRVAPQITCTWVVAPADAAVYWLLETAGASELNLATRPGYF